MELVGFCWARGINDQRCRPIYLPSTSVWRKQIAAITQHIVKFKIAVGTAGWSTGLVEDDRMSFGQTGQEKKNHWPAWCCKAVG